MSSAWEWSTLVDPGVALGFVMVVASAAIVAALWWLSRDANDPGPWALDERWPINGHCRYRSLASTQRCRKRHGHRGNHDGAELADDVIEREYQRPSNRR